jgi:hypothetical protein
MRRGLVRFHFRRRVHRPVVYRGLIVLYEMNDGGGWSGCSPSRIKWRISKSVKVLARRACALEPADLGTSVSVHREKAPPNITIDWFQLLTKFLYNN